jgi:hypothetical protein
VWTKSKSNELNLTKSINLPSRAMKRDVKAVDAWDFKRIIPCHGVRSRCFNNKNDR